MYLRMKSYDVLILEASNYVITLLYEYFLCCYPVLILFVSSLIYVLRGHPCSTYAPNKERDQALCACKCGDVVIFCVQGVWFGLEICAHVLHEWPLMVLCGNSLLRDTLYI